MGSIYKRGKTYWIQYYRNGKPYRESTKSKKEADAKRLLKKREGEISEGKLPGIYFDKARFNELAALKRMLNLGAKQTPPKVDRVPHIPMLKEYNVCEGFFGHGEFNALRSALPSYIKGFDTFAYKTGWRVPLIAGLTRSQVDRDNGIARLEAGETKNSDARTVYLVEELKEVIARQWEGRENLLPYVFLNDTGTDKIKRFDKSWKSACKIALGYYRRFHDLRRTAVRIMVRPVIPERVAMMISGHKTRSVFERDNIVNDADLQLAAQRQEAYLQT
jgi:integrase